MVTYAAAISEAVRLKQLSQNAVVTAAIEELLYDWRRIEKRLAKIPPLKKMRMARGDECSHELFGNLISNFLSTEGGGRTNLGPSGEGAEPILDRDRSGTWGYPSRIFF